ncbi:hypothetical protein F2P45_26725 [Massilia sp. CCM 8733]|uniref:Uncharacterized protein n=1 Tax=Massilia mucilaginosa TaxID=2609282 RepID=A0ABX0P053_9BURK|nr:hypothetical protein [Massilia mucilaginosa]NHZ92575.1 hypothetical protein [Massilia mucilaginosa]
MFDIMEHSLQNLTNRPSEIDQVVADLNNAMQGVEATQSAQLQLAQAALANKQQSSFESLMEASKAQAKADVNAAIDKAYATLTTIGQQHPESQSAIVAAMAQCNRIADTTISGVNAALDTLSDTARTVFNGVADAATTVAGGVTTAAGAVGTVVNDAGNAIAKVFSGW